MPKKSEPESEPFMPPVEAEPPVEAALEQRKADLLAALADVEAEEKVAAKVEYPKTLYHRSGSQRTVADAAAHEALGEGWAESPAEFES